MIPAALEIADFDNSYARLPQRFHAPQVPVHVAQPSLIIVNAALAETLGLRLDGLDAAALAELFSGRQLPAGSSPLAMAYAGHQFGNFVPVLGDGRALLLGEVIDRQGQRRDLQLKGAGRTPFSRRGDGRAALGPVLREYLVAEAMHALGIPTTRALAAVRTGESVLREGPLPGAVLTRVAASHLRIGTFEYFAAHDDREGLRLLSDYAIARHVPEAAVAPVPPLALLETVIERQAALVAQWMLVGFIHGVMNTDNMTISGETIDYGPCAFLEHYDPAAVFSAIDRQGRYAYGRQPEVAHWNLAQLARALLPLLAEDEETALAMARGALETFAPHFAGHWLAGMRAKLGLSDAEDGDADLIDDWLALLEAQRIDFTLAFRGLGELARPGANTAPLAALFADPTPLYAWLQRWRDRCAREATSDGNARALRMASVNPLVIPRNHLVEQALQAAASGDDGPFHRLHAALLRPFADDEAQQPFAVPARAEERVTRTFCGT